MTLQKRKKYRDIDYVGQKKKKRLNKKMKKRNVNTCGKTHHHSL